MSETKTNAVPSSVNLTDLVAKFKVIARDTLRAKLISARQSKVANLTADIAYVTKEIADLNHEILVENYEIGVLDTKHPDYEATKTEKEATVTELTAEAKDLTDNNLVDLIKEVAEQTDGIAKIQSGETKVSLEELNSLVETMLNQYAKNQANP